jgi:1-acyl-sn-glycerol-3-phosphate acyltransferase
VNKNKKSKTKSRAALPVRNPRRPGRAGGTVRKSAEADAPAAERPSRGEKSAAKEPSPEARPPGRRGSAAPAARRSTGEGRGRPVERNAPTLASFPRRRSPSERDPAGETSEPGGTPDATQSDTETEILAREEPSGVDDARDTDDIEELPVDSTSEDIGMLGIGSRVYPPNMEFEVFSDAELGQHEVEPMDDPSVEARIRDIEARLDGLMEGVDFSTSTVTPLGQPVPRAQAEEAVDAARELLESDYYRRNFGRGARSLQEGGIDEFGLDPDTEQRLMPLIDFLYKRYFRVEVEGIENIPARGRAVVVANHSGTLPFDGAMLRAAVRRHHSKPRDLRWLAEDISFYLPFVGVTMNRIGAVRACQENATRLLLTDHVVAVFPEGAEGIKKLYKDRYQLQRFGRGGFVRLCLKTRSPIVPCAIVGAEETNPILYRFDNLSKLLGLDYLPVTPTFPLLGPLGLLPAPTKWRMLFGAPISVEEYGPAAAEDHVLVGRLSERVRAAINGLLETGLRRRRSIWL